MVRIYHNVLIEPSHTEDMMPRTRLAAALLCAGVAAPFVFPAYDVAANAPADTLFADEFNSPTLDRSRWNVIVTGDTYNDEQQAYVDSPDTLYIARGAEAAGADGGALAIHARYRPGFFTPDLKVGPTGDRTAAARNARKFDFVSGRIDGRAKAEFTYGLASARMKLPAGSGFWPAFWLLGAGDWPATGEIDVMENVGERDWISAALHGPGYSGNTPLVQRAPFPKGTDATAWHVYSVDWAKDGFVFKVDNQTIYRVTRRMVEEHGRWAYDNRKFVILNLALGGNYPFTVNKAQSPYKGMTDATVQAIKEGKGIVLVDWVRVRG